MRRRDVKDGDGRKHADVAHRKIAATRSCRLGIVATKLLLTTRATQPATAALIPGYLTDGVGCRVFKVQKRSHYNNLYQM